ncbi:hypothetical protein LJB87_01570 [Alistipes sp. OttesenSCG-928-L06]|nr:hypothetical protein [Alistipes sp. OttesenSCG-928-L06]
MKKGFLILFCMLLFGSCGHRRSEPEKAAWGFLHAYYTNDYAGALQYADSTTAAELSNTMELLRAEGMTTTEMKNAARSVIIEVEGIIANDGYRAVCAYKLKNSPDDYNAMMETLMLYKTADGWKVAF